MRAMRPWLCLVLFLISAHRLPAPIQEVPENSPPSPEQPAKPNPKRTVKPKITNESSTKRQTALLPPKSQSTPTQPRFAGSWNGIINCGIAGNIEHTIAIDAAQKLMTVWQTNNPSVRGSGSAQIAGDTITVRYGDWGQTWSVTPYPDAQTARVRFRAFLVDGSAVFRRTTP